MSNGEYSKNHSVFIALIVAVERNAVLMEKWFAVPFHGVRFVLCAG